MMFFFYILGGGGGGGGGGEEKKIEVREREGGVKNNDDIERIDGA